MSQIKIGAILSYFSLILSVLIALVYTPILVGNLGQSEYGIYTLMAAFVGYLSILDMGLGNAIVRYVARTRVNNDREHEAKLSGMFLILFTILGVVVAVLGTIMYFQIDFLFGKKIDFDELQLAKKMAIILIVNFVVSFPLSVFGAFIQAHERFVFLKLTSIIRTVITPLVTVPMLFMGYGSIMLVSVTAIANIVFLLLNMIYCFKILQIKLKFEKFDRVLLKEVVIYSSFIFLNAIIDKIYWSTDQIILGSVSGTDKVAIYAIAIQFIMIYMSLSTAISGLFLPKISIMEMKGASDNEFSDLFIKAGRIQAFIMMFILGGFIVVGEQFIELWLDKSYRDAYFITIIIMIPLTISLVQNTGISILQAKNLHAFRSISFIITALINLIISIPVAKYYGYIGVASITAITLFINQAIILNIYYFVKIKLDIPSFWRNTIGSIFNVIGCIVVISTLKLCLNMDNYIAKLFLIALIYSLIYVTFLWIFVLTKNEKSKFKNKILINLKR